MAADTRIYVVFRKDGSSTPRLVRATNPSQALRHVTGDTFATAPARQDDLVSLISSGVAVEDYNAAVADLLEAA